MAIIDILRSASSSPLLNTVLFTVICLVVYKLVTFVLYLRYLNQTYGDVQGPNRRHWLFGDLINFPKTPHGRLQHFLDLTRKYSKNGYYRLWFGYLKPRLMIDSPETMRRILKTAEPKPLGLGSGYLYLRDWLGDGLLIAKGARWARSRRLLTPAFHFDILKSYMTVYNEAAQILADKIDTYAGNGNKFEVFEHILPCTLDVILRSAFSYEIDPQRKGETHPYIQAVNRISETVVDRSLKPYLAFSFLFYMTPTGRKMKQDCEYVHNVAYDIIAKRRARLEKEGPSSRKNLDFLDILLTAKDETGVGLTTIEIRDEVDTFLFEGHDTTGSAISWVLYSLAEHPDIQRRAQEEVDEVLGNRESNTIQWSDLPKFEYLTMCIKEGMRLHVPVAIIGRQATKDFDIGDRVFPKGTEFAVSMWALHHNEKVWQDPDTFDPERFAKDKLSTMDSFQFVPFSAGPRNCIGQNFAMNEEKVVLAQLLRRFTFRLDPEHVVKKKLSAVMRTENGMLMYAERRRTP